MVEKQGYTNSDAPQTRTVLMKPANSQKGSNARETPVTGCSLNPRASPKPHRLPPSLFPLPQASLSSASSPNPPAGARLRLQPTRCCPGQEQGFDTWSVAHLCRAQTCCHVGSLAKGLAWSLQGEHQQEMVVLLLVRAAERWSRAQGQAAAPPGMCLVLPLCFGAVNHSAWNKICSNRGSMAPRDKPHLGSRWEALLNWQELAMGDEGGFDSADTTPQEPGIQHKNEQGEFIHNPPPPEDLSLL